MRRSLAALALAGTLAGAAVAVPAVSWAATGDAPRVTALREALEGLVGDGTLTDAQADRVADTLAERGPRGRGHHKALEDLGITRAEVRAAARAGTTLGALADEQGVPRDDVVEALVARGQERLAKAVAKGRLTQEQADEREAELRERATAALDEPVARPGRGPKR